MRAENIRIVVPRGKLGAFHWYERDQQLYADEREAMARFFPQFREMKLLNRKPKA